MKIAGGMAAALAFGGIAVGSASPASADDLLGTYTMQLGDNTSTWTVTPCASDPNQTDFVPCVHVADSGGNFAPWQADARSSVGYWTLAVDRPDAVSCEDGSTLPATVHYWWNPATLEGKAGFFFGGGCGDVPASSLYGPFTLTKTDGPAPEAQA